MNREALRNISPKVLSEYLSSSGSWRNRGYGWSLPGRPAISVFVPWDLWRSKGRSGQTIPYSTDGSAAYIDAMVCVISVIAHAEGRDPSEVIDDIEELRR